MKRIQLFLLLSSAWVPVVFADLTVVSEMNSEGRQLFMKMEMAGNKARVGTGMGATIFLPSEDKMIMLMSAQKTYIVRPLETHSMPEKQEKEALGTFEKTGKQETINGFECIQFLYQNPDGGQFELWVSPKGPKLSKMMQFFSMLEQQPGMKNQIRSSWKQVIAQHPELKTYPIRIVELDAHGQELNRSTIRSVSNVGIPGSVFQIPGDYREMRVPGMADVSQVPGSSAFSNQKAIDEIGKLQREIQASGGRPTPEQLKKLQELALQLGRQN
ncbi:MAG: DUF4412 domain-containing protein [Verrucomicrobiota bacterium]